MRCLQRMIWHSRVDNGEYKIPFCMNLIVTLVCLKDSTGTDTGYRTGAVATHQDEGPPHLTCRTVARSFGVVHD